MSILWNLDMGVGWTFKTQTQTQILKDPYPKPTFQILKKSHTQILKKN